jgi:hypothetical protein
MKKQDVLDILEQGGITSDYLEENENIIEGGGDEWMEFVSFYIGKNSYDDSDWTDDDHDKLQEFIHTLYEHNIDLL